MKSPSALAALFLAAAIGPGVAHATLVIDTGTPTDLSTPLVLDGNDYYAAEFNLASMSVINSVSAYFTAGLDSPGDTFTVAIYADPITARSAAPDYVVQGTYAADGWNQTGLGGLGIVEGPGNYWVAFEVGSQDSALGLGLPTGTTTGGTVPALAFAFNSGSGYTTNGALPFSVQVDVSPVPAPPTAWLFGGGLVGIGALVRRRRATV